MPLQLHVHIVMKMSNGGRRPSLAEGSAIIAVKCKLGIVQHLPLVFGQPKHEGVRSKPVKNCATQSEQRPGLVHWRSVEGQTPNRLVLPGEAPVGIVGGPTATVEARCIQLALQQLDFRMKLRHVVRR